MTFFKSHQKLHIWLLADLVLLAAVSYTHLDVYKRQERSIAAFPEKKRVRAICQKPADPL